ncbi:MAG TPA: alcohol dehydrogenase catalytic domain-containing protein [bacterium]|nr:alcohol dehydrogenase catalytic domain-containing protein [bacterium]
MKALRFNAGELEIRDVPAPVPGSGEALIKVSTAGICNTDVEILKGYMKFNGVPGHEFVGVVESSPNKKQIGKRVVGEINCACGECCWCNAGMERHCFQRDVLGILKRNGAFAEYLTLPAGNLRIVPDSLPDEKAVFVEPLAACFEIVGQVEFPPDALVCVIGDGKLGLLAARVLRDKAFNLTLIGKHERNMAIASKKFKVEAITEDSIGDEQYDIVVECSGKPSGLELATRLVRPRGRIVLKSTYHEKPSIDVSLWVVNEITIVGSRCGPFDPALEALASGEINPSPLIDGIFPFNQIAEAFEAAQKPGSLKFLVKFD